MEERLNETLTELQRIENENGALAEKLNETLVELQRIKKELLESDLQDKEQQLNEAGKSVMSIWHVLHHSVC